MSSAFNPSRLAPVDTHAQGRTLIETDAIHWSGGQRFTVPEEHGSTWSWQGGGLTPLQLAVSPVARVGIEPSDYYFFYFILANIEENVGYTKYLC